MVSGLRALDTHRLKRGINLALNLSILHHPLEGPPSKEHREDPEQLETGAGHPQA